MAPPPGSHRHTGPASAPAPCKRARTPPHRVIQTPRMTSAEFKEIYRHMEWADSEVWRAVLAAPAARTDETLRRLLLHLHVVQRAFLNMWEGRAVAFPDLASFPDITDIHAWAQPYYAAADAFVDGVTAESLSRP